MVEAVITLVVLGGFGYFVYTRIQKANERDTSGGTGSGGGDNGSNTVEH